MTRDEDIERVLDRWFTEGPTQMPTRLFNETLDRIDRAPKRRGMLGIPRPSNTSRNVRLAGLAAVVVAMVGVGAVFMTQQPSVGVMPSPSPTSTASAAPAIVDPSTIETKWTSIGERPAFGSGSDTTEASFIWDATSLAIDAFFGPVDNAWSLTGPDNRLVVRTLSTTPMLHKHWRCDAGQVGAYTVSVSSDANLLTLRVVTDACETRALILDGDWTRWPCSNPLSVCGAELAPGEHVDAFPRYDDGNGSLGPLPFLSGFSYTVPAGWTGDSGLLFRRNDPGAMSVATILDVAPHTQDPTCPDAADPGVQRTIDAIADWLTRVPGLVTTIPAPIEIGGYQGLVIDVSIVPGWTTPECYFDNPIVMTFADPVPLPDGGVFVRESVERDSHARYILLDVGKGHNLLIEIQAPDKASWDDLVQAAMPIVESFRFTVGSGS